MISIPGIKYFDKDQLKLNRVQEYVYIVGIRRLLVTLDRYLKNKFYTMVIFVNICGLIRSGKARWFHQNLGGESGLNN